jgi:hypothetical protein
MQQINEVEKGEGDGDKNYKRAYRPQAANSDSGVHFWWPHEGRNNHIHDIEWPSQMIQVE